jgi:hypothetical protein
VQVHSLATVQQCLAPLKVTQNQVHPAFAARKTQSLAGGRIRELAQIAEPSWLADLSLNTTTLALPVPTSHAAFSYSAEYDENDHDNQ